MTSHEAIKRLSEIEQKLYLVSMQVKMPAYALEEMKEIGDEVKAVREAMFNGFPCSKDGVCPFQSQPVTEPTTNEPVT